jgi:5-methylcytosine-specific restriction enzyme subunit McrC
VSEGNLHKLKGRILFRQHVSRNLLHKERIYTAHQVPVNGIPSDDDLRQMFAYNVHFGGRRGVLLYPLASHEQTPVGHNFEPSRAVAPGFAHDCGTFYVDMFDANQRLRKDIGAQIIQQAVIHD